MSETPAAEPDPDALPEFVGPYRRLERSLRARSKLFVVAGLLAACSGISAQALVPAGTATGDPSTPPTSNDADTAGVTVDREVDSSLSERDDTTTSTSDSLVAADDSELADQPRALVTPSGVVVSVVGRTSSGYLVTTPCGNQATASWGTPIYRADVVLDPGHGGDIETGAVGLNGLVEKDLNLSVAQATARNLTDRGYDVVLTRTSDYRVPLSVRAGLANWLDAGALVSIHHNAPNARRSSEPGTEVFTQSGSDESARLGALIWEDVMAALGEFDDVSWVAAPDAGALEVLGTDGDDAYGMVRRPTVPAVLAELGYLSNRSEAELFATSAYVEAMGEALSEAIERFLESSDPGSGHITDPRVFDPRGGTGGEAGCVDPDLYN